MALSPQAIIHAEPIQLTFVTRMAFTSAYVAVVWDWLSHLGQEANIWRGPNTAVKWTFLFLRYWTLLATPVALVLIDGNWTNEECGRIFLLQPFTSMWTSLAGELILLLRTYAIWEKNRYILGLGLTLFVGMVVTNIVVAFGNAPPPLPLGLESFSCLPIPKPGNHEVLAFFFYPLGFDAIMTGLAMWKALKFHKTGTASSVLTTFVRDGTIFFILTFLVNVTSIVFFFQTATPFLQPITAGAGLLLNALLAMHLILHLRAKVESRTGSSAGASTHGSQANVRGPQRSNPNFEFVQARSRAGSNVTSATANTWRSGEKDLEAAPPVPPRPAEGLDMASPPPFNSFKSSVA